MINFNIVMLIWSLHVKKRKIYWFIIIIIIIIIITIIITTIIIIIIIIIIWKRKCFAWCAMALKLNQFDKTSQEKSWIGGPKPQQM